MHIHNGSGQKLYVKVCFEDRLCENSELGVLGDTFGKRSQIDVIERVGGSREDMFTVTSEQHAMSSIKSPVSRQAFWENHVHAWQDSGLSKARYCREHTLSYHQFIYWIPKICPADLSNPATARAPKFLPVAVEHQAGSPGLQVRLPNGVIISGITVNSVQVVGALMAQL